MYLINTISHFSEFFYDFGIISEIDKDRFMSSFQLIVKAACGIGQ